MAVVVAMVATVVATVVAAAGAPAARAAGAVSPFDYRLGPRDVLAVTVFSAVASATEEDTKVHTVTVSLAGNVALPLVGKVKVQGMTPTELETTLLERFKRYFNAPQVSVSVVEYRSKPVWVLGQVVKNGPVHLIRERTSLAEVVSEAGGFINPTTTLTEGADSRNIIITRGQNRMVVNLHAQLTNLTRVDEFIVEPGDLVFVPKPLKRFQVLGGVNKAGEFELVEGMTMLRALSLAGSFNEKARRERVYILRAKPDGSKESIHVDCRKVTDGGRMDPTIEPDDVVFVAEW